MAGNLREQPRGAESSLPAEDRIDVICDRFEQAILRGENPDLANFLDASDPSERSRQFTELLLVEIEYRHRGGETPRYEDYLPRFAEFSSELASLALTRSLEGYSTRTDDSARVTGESNQSRRIAHFELLEKLGSGAAGEVWKARDERLQRLVAIKLPRNRYISDEERHRFLREGRAAAQLKHPGIVAVHDVDFHDGSLFIVSDFIAGEDLRRWLTKCRPSSNQAAELCAAVADALHHAHEQGVIHRDLKPANVMIDQLGEPHLTDFGLAKWTEDAHQMTFDGQPLGTPAYMSPEQARGDAAHVDQRTDIYALGVLLYEMLTGTAPFLGDQAAIMQAVVNQDPQPPRTLNRAIPRDLETVCLKAMDKDLAHRYSTAAEMASDLRRFLRGEPIQARRLGMINKSWRWVRRRPSMAAAIALAFVVLVSLLVVQNLAQENRELIGLRSVTIASDPPGAEIVFVPLNKVTGEPVPEQKVRAWGRHHADVDLKPGDYFVVAILDDLRFHEVLRHVPSSQENLPGSYNHLFWRISEDDQITLPTITIPDHDVVDAMSLISVTDGSSSLATNRDQQEAIRPFYVDTTEFTIRDYYQHAARAGCDRPPNGLNSDLSYDEAMRVDYDQAVSFAERAGKRLPSEYEYIHVATNGRTTRFPWGDVADSPSGETLAAFGEVGQPDFDRTESFPPVYGLCSNVAEWTSSWAVPGSRYESLPMADLFSPESFRVVVGGVASVIHGRAQVDSNSRDPHFRLLLVRPSKFKGLGFRCVRSTEPSYID